MRLSIRKKLFIGVSSLIVFFVLFAWFLNSNFLGKYYLYEKKNMLSDTFKQINSIVKNETFENSVEIEKLERTQNIHILVLDSKFNVVYESPGERKMPPGPGQFGPMHAISTDKLSQLKTGETSFDVNEDARLNANFVDMIGKLDDGDYSGDYIILNTPLSAISESAAIANRFFMFTGVLTIILGSIGVFIFSKKFTKPILELNEVAQAMSGLDFSKRCTIKTKDEIGELGRSINSLSNQLDASITELREANIKLKEDVDRERKIDKMRKNFISNVSHELKTPIALIQGYAIGLKVNVNEDEESKDFYCDVIIDESDKMDKLVKQLLELSQIESGNLRIDEAEFDLSQHINNIVQKYKPIFQEKNILLETNIKDKLYVKADVLRIEQVLTNFINNAVNHVDFDRKIIINAEEINHKVEVSVFNSGKCIPEESIDKLWESFYKVDKARTRAYGGAGLGLSIVKNIMELHNSKCGVENLPGGVRFWFQLEGVYNEKHV
ncbi:MAG: HAMP domain-containing sensor histidine kinase [Bacillota bacterium]|nr:HAMP domain-containing sensor histidine kinase [Bacillota bacterium]